MKRESAEALHHISRARPPHCFPGSVPRSTRFRRHVTETGSHCPISVRASDDTSLLSSHMRIASAPASSAMKKNPSFFNPVLLTLNRRDSLLFDGMLTDVPQDSQGRKGRGAPAWGCLSAPGRSSSWKPGFCSRGCRSRHLLGFEGSERSCLCLLTVLFHLGNASQPIPKGGVTQGKISTRAGAPGPPAPSEVERHYSRLVCRRPELSRFC